VRSALQSGDWEQLPDGGFRAAGHELGPDDVLVERHSPDGAAVAADDGVTVSLDTSLDDDLLREGRVLDLIHRVNTMRKEAGLVLTDRIALTLPSGDEDLLGHEDWIKAETLATGVALGPELGIEKA
jgi:isoleucyl-tRNA synthetase